MLHYSAFFVHIEGVFGKDKRTG